MQCKKKKERERDDWWIGKISQKRRKEIAFSMVKTIWHEAVKCFCSLSATQNLSRSPSSMPRLVYLRRFTSLGVIPWETIHAVAAALAPFFLILLKSGPTDDETFLPFSGSLWNRFLIFQSRAKTSARPGSVASPRIRMSQTPEWKQKARPLAENIINISFSGANTGGRRRADAAPGMGGILTAAAVVKDSSLIQDSAGGEIYSTCRGFSVFFLKLHDAGAVVLFTAGCKTQSVWLRERGTPTFLSFTAAPLGSAAAWMAQT